MSRSHEATTERDRKTHDRVKRSIHLFWLASLFLLAAVSTASADDSPFSEFVVFGDSLSDTGNVFWATQFQLPPSPLYFDGRFSNGPVWHEILAERLGAAPAAPNLIGGTNYAWGGAETGSGMSLFEVPNLGDQIGLYLSMSAPQPRQLFIVAGGGNDILPPGPIQAPEAIVANIMSHVETLIDTGAQSILVINIPPLERSPAIAELGEDTAAATRRAIRKSNVLLRRAIGGLRRDLRRHGIHADVFFVDIYKPWRALLAHPTFIGVENTTVTAIDPPECPPCIGDVVDEPNTFFWYDTVHPTAPVHEAIGRVVAWQLKLQIRARRR
ncbi:MAG: SGNH/GDSL hydrolase family protein [Pseudomonadota bacterium]